jgi:hypothetical protein
MLPGNLLRLGENGFLHIRTQAAIAVVADAQ